MARPSKTISRRFIYFFGAFGGILFGYDIGVMTGALPFLKIDWGIEDPALIGWITSILMLGAIFGGIAAGHLSDKYGRRKVILGSSFVFAIGAVMGAASPNNMIAWLLASRVLLGLGVGAASALVPSYMSEMAPAKKRGMLSGLNQLMIVSGMLLSYIVDYSLQWAPNNISWRLMLGLAAVPAVILLLGVLRLPESPRFLVKKEMVDEARQVLSYIRKDDEIEPELKEIIKTASDENKRREKVTFRYLFSKKYRYLVIAGVGVAFLQQIMGANAIFYYIPLIVEEATGAATSSALLWPVVQGCILVAGAVFYMALADKFRRRHLIMTGGIIMGLSFLMPAILGALLGSAFPRVMIIGFLCLYVAFYSFTWAPLTWVIVGEIFPLGIRGRASGLASSMNWLGSFAVGLLFPIMTAAMSQEIVFAIFGVICLLAVLFVKFRVPETHGKSLEQIEKDWSNK